MPTPMEILFDPATLATLAIVLALALWEWLAPGRPLPRVRGWALRAGTAMAGYLLLATYLPLLWAGLLAPLQLFDFSAWPTWAAAATGVLVYEFGAYAYHWSMHRFEPMWRVLHQMHHSAERQDVASAFWFSPWDMVGWTLLASVILTMLGLSAPAATAALLVITFLAVFQHANIRTPVWLGYFVQRPESHSVHHQRGVHRYNYADLPVVDMLFGTFRNPSGYSPATGFWHGASSRVPAMLAARDIAAQPSQGEQS